MKLTHIHAFTAAMQRKDLDAMLVHMSDDVRLLTPLVAEPFQGKASIRPVVEALLAVVDSFEFLELMEGPQQRIRILQSDDRVARARRHGLLAPRR